MRPKFFRQIRLDGTKALAAGPIDLSPGDIEVAVWARIIQYQTPDGTPVDKDKVSEDPHLEVSGWNVNGMTREEIEVELRAAIARLEDVQAKVERAVPDPKSAQERALAEFTVRNDHGPWWPQVEVTARECLPRNGAQKPGEPCAFGLGPAHAEAWIWVNREDDDGGTYQFSLYWNDDLELADQQVPPEEERAASASQA